MARRRKMARAPMARPRGKLDAKRLGMSLGVLWGAAVLVMGLAAAYADYGASFVNFMGSLYPGYDATVSGSVIGGIIGFVDGGICGYLIAWLYNRV